MGDPERKAANVAEAHHGFERACVAAEVSSSTLPSLFPTDWPVADGLGNCRGRLAGRMLGGS